MGNIKQNYFQRRSKPQGPRSNQRIRANEVQVIGSDGQNLGVIPTRQAVTLAKNEGLDLIEIAPNTNPPVCKIMDIGKYKYDQQKKASQQKKKQKVSSIKEIKLRPVTESHDYNFKIKNAKKFILKGNKVKITVKFKGREMQHVNLGRDLMNRIIEDTKEVAKVETQPKFEGKQMIMVIQPQ